MKHLIVLFLISLSLSCNAQQTNKFNLDFETGTPGKPLPEGWMKWGSYSLDKDTAVAHSGKYAVLINSDGQRDEFGSIAYRIPANYEGSFIQLEGFMKTQEVEHGFAGLLLRVDDSETVLAFDNMESQKVQGTQDWEKYTIRLPFPEGAEQIYVAGILVGKGKAWFDDFVLTIDGKNVQTLEEKKDQVFKADLDKTFDKGSGIKFPELTEGLITNLELLGRIWGFLKYHHPEASQGNYNWDYELFRILPKYLEASDPSNRDQILLNWIAQYGPIPPCKKCKKTDRDAFLKPDLSWIKDSGVSSALAAKLNEVYQNRRQGKHFYIRMAPNVGNPEFLNENAYADMPYPDEGFRLLALYKYWNMIQYFFPYKHLMDKNWNDVLKAYIPIFIHAKDELEYELAAVQIIGDIKDTHANLWSGNDKIQEIRGRFYPPFYTQFIEKKLVVTDYYNKELETIAELKLGDVITHINGKTTESIVSSLWEYYPASNDAAKLRDISTDLLRSNNPKISIQYVSDGQKKEKDLLLYPRDSLQIYRWYRKDDALSYKLLEGNIGYITLKSIKDKDIAGIKESFKNAKGIIIDIRNYPSTFVPFSLGSFFVSASTPFVKFTKGNLDNPGEFIFTKPLEIPKSNNSFRGKLVVIVNEFSQSQAEYTAMAFRAGDNTTIIGSTTAGADGNVSTIVLPGGLKTMISGIGVYYPDGKETQRLGIVPDLEIKPTIAGIKNGKDELLERAIALISE
ncbi:MAG: peptidase S41 [Saprospiraceae bacterium]|nr:peptidase S41 [Saprospiraceae bacterium]